MRLQPSITKMPHVRQILFALLQSAIGKLQVEHFAQDLRMILSGFENLDLGLFRFRHEVAL